MSIPEDPEGSEYALHKAWWHAYLGLMGAHMMLLPPDSESRDEVAKHIEEHMERSLAAFHAYARRSGVTVEGDEEEVDWDVPLSDQEAAAELIRSSGAVLPKETDEEGNE